MGCDSSDAISQAYQDKIPLMELICKHCDVTIVQYDIQNKLKAIVLTDVHFGKFFPASQSIPKLFNYLKKIVEMNNANIVFLLGDIFDVKALDVKDGQTFIDTFSSFPIPIHFISGNHDRIFYKKLNIHGSIHYCPTRVMKIESQITHKFLFFAHDFGNSYKLTKHEIQSFIWSNKRAQKKLMSLKDWLIIGHTHYLCINKEKRFASLAPFSFDLNKFCFCVVDEKEEEFELSFHSIEAESEVSFIVNKIEEENNYNEEKKDYEEVN